MAPIATVAFTPGASTTQQQDPRASVPTLT